MFAVCVSFLSPLITPLPIVKDTSEIVIPCCCVLIAFSVQCVTAFLCIYMLVQRESCAVRLSVLLGHVAESIDSCMQLFCHGHRVFSSPSRVKFIRGKVLCRYSEIESSSPIEVSYFGPSWTFFVGIFSVFLDPVSRSALESVANDIISSSRFSPQAFTNSRRNERG